MAGSIEQMEVGEDWERTGNKDEDELEFYLKGLHYDCTLRVSNSETGSKSETFKCHKFVLARASRAFERMLMGPFKESSQGRDTEINISSRISPEAFDLALRFIYGNERDFKTVELAVELYYFANEWMISSLTEGATEYLDSLVLGGCDVLMVLEMFLFFEIEGQAENYLELVKEDTLDVLQSEKWLTVSEQLMLEICQLQILSVSEAVLLRYVILWGQAQTGGSEDPLVIRAKIDPCLAFIRFKSMDSATFSEICNDEYNVLTAEEKSQIWQCIACPSILNYSTDNIPRNLESSESLKWDSLDRNICILDKSTTNFTFYVDVEGVYLQGIYLYSLIIGCANNKDIIFSVNCTLWKESPRSKLASVTFQGTSVEDDDQCIKFDQPIALEKFTLYTIKLRYVDAEGALIVASFFDAGVRHVSLGNSKLKLFFPPHCPDQEKMDICGFLVSSVPPSEIEDDE